MWGKKGPSATRRNGRDRRRGSPVLEVNTPLMARQKDRSHRQTVSVIVGVGVVVLLVLGWVGVRWAGAALFWDNPRFAIRHVDVRPPGTLASEFIRDKSGIVEGRNLFSFRIGQVRREFLREATSFRAMEIVRELPDTVRVSVTDRIPVARVGTSDRIVTDSDGYVFGARMRSIHLPLISGPSCNDRPGSRLDAMGRAAIQVVEMCSGHPLLGLQIDAIDVDLKGFLWVRMADQKIVKLAWRGMDDPSPESDALLLQKLGWVARSLQTEQAGSRALMDATFDDGRVFAR